MPCDSLGMYFWVWFDLWRLPRETVSKSCGLLEVILLLTINLSTLSYSVETENRAVFSGVPQGIITCYSLISVIYLVVSPVSGHKVGRLEGWNY